jgi:uncharacterized caspase-like protein
MPRRRRALPIAGFLLIGALVMSSAATAEKRVALVIGNASYVHVARLANSGNDARLLANTLRDLGFALVGDGPQLDLDKSHLDRVVKDFGAQLKGAEVGLFYYAGHGLQVQGRNYLVPVDANPIDESDVPIDMLDSEILLGKMQAAGTRLNLMILDACRNNPFSGRGLRATGSPRCVRRKGR